MGDWERPKTAAAAVRLVLRFEKLRDYENAALACLAVADMSWNKSDAHDIAVVASFERQAQVYATLHAAGSPRYLVTNNSGSL